MNTESSESGAGIQGGMLVQMQKQYYRYPQTSILHNARIFFEWVIAPRLDDERLTTVSDGPPDPNHWKRSADSI